MTAITVHFDERQMEALRTLAARRNVTVEELVRERALPPAERSNSEKLNADLERLWASFPPGFKPPTDVEVEQILIEERMRKYGNR